MIRNWHRSTTLIALCCVAAPLALAANSSAPDAAAPIRVFTAKQLAKVVPGLSKGQVRSLLGAPWRTVQYNDMDELEDEIWEYRGQDSNGPYRIHIEFDHHDIVRIVGKIPDTTASKSVPGKN
jgi:hypothetical protein